MSFDYSQTYLYKLHKLTNLLDKTFDQHLRRHSNIGFSQFSLLLSIAQHQPATQRTIADFLDLSPGAISRQVDIARQNGWIDVSGTEGDKRALVLTLTAEGKAMIAGGMETLERCVFQIFDHSNSHTHLMAHLDMLLTSLKSLSTPEYSPLKDPVITHPKAADFFRRNGGDLNAAVIDTQRATGRPIDEDWWQRHIGTADNNLETALRFDEAYTRYLKENIDN